MDDRNFKLAEELVNPTYIRLAQNSLNRRDRMMRELLTQRQLPEEPIDDLTIRYILDTLALMDSNNFHQKAGVGERESRVFSRLVEERHFHMGHGIGSDGVMQEEAEM
jgi:O-phospho-L-seryl-tRNASec:L-selenocysteinyl-tRNA synthase